MFFSIFYFDDNFGKVLWINNSQCILITIFQDLCRRYVACRILPKKISEKIIVKC